MTIDFEKGIITYARLLQHPAGRGGNTGCLVTGENNFKVYTGYLRQNNELEDNTVIFGKVSSVMPYVPAINQNLFVTPNTGVVHRYQYPRGSDFYNPVIKLR